MYLLFDIGGTNTRLSLLQDKTELSSTDVFPTPKNFEAAVTLIRQYLYGKNLEGQIQECVGGVAGRLSADKSKLEYSPNLPLWVGRNLREELSSIIGCKIVLENDAALGALGEAVYGAGKTHKIVVYLTISTGVGGARVVNKKIDDSRYGFEPGHQIIDFNKMGGVIQILSLEQLVSGTAFFKKYGHEPSEVKDPKIWDEITAYLAIGVHNTMLHWSPDVVILGGSMMKSIDILKLVGKLRGVMKSFSTLPIVAKSTLQHNGIYGAWYILQNMQESNPSMM